MRTPGQHRIGKFSDHVDHMLAVVENEEEAPRREGLHHRFVDRSPRDAANPEYRRDLGDHLLGVAHRREFHQPNAVALAVEQLGRDLHCEPRLPVPPTPTSVSNRPPPTSACTFRSSAARPTSSSRNAEGCDESRRCPTTATPGTCR